MVDQPSSAPRSPAPRPGLRARKKAATMHRIQMVALSLFDEHGFDAVTIEQVAAAAEVSPSTVYRYFSTKEGLVVHDEYDDRVLQLVGHYLGEGMRLSEVLSCTLDDVWQGHFDVHGELSLRRTRWAFEVPSIQAAVSLEINKQVDDIARVLERSGRWSFHRARVISSAVVWAVVAVLRSWFEAGGQGDLRRQFDEVIDWLARAEPTGPAGATGPTGPTKAGDI